MHRSGYAAYAGGSDVPASALMPATLPLQQIPFQWQPQPPQQPQQLAAMQATHLLQGKQRQAAREMLRMIDEFCSMYVVRLSEDLKPPSSNSLAGGQQAGVVAAAKPPMVVQPVLSSAPVSGELCLKSIADILNAPEHSPSAIPPLHQSAQPLNHAELHAQLTQARQNCLSSNRLAGAAAAPPSKKQQSRKPKLAPFSRDGAADKDDDDSEMEDAAAEEDGDVEEEAVDEEFMLSSSDDDYRPKSGNKKSKTKRAAAATSASETIGRQRNAPALVVDSKQRRSKLPLKATVKLREFFIAHIDNPFPNDEQKKQIATETDLLFKQVSDWFTNTRKRFWRPYKNWLGPEGCILAEDCWATCKCPLPEQGAMGRKKKPAGGGAAAAATAAAAAAAAAAGGEGEEDEEGSGMPLPTTAHSWWFMWN